MFRDTVLNFAKFMALDPALIEETIVYVQVVAHKTSNLAAVNEARLVRYTVCEHMKIRYIQIMFHRYSDRPWWWETSWVRRSLSVEFLAVIRTAKDQ